MLRSILQRLPSTARATGRLQAIRAASSATGDAIPIIDFEPFLKGSDNDKRAVARKIDDACRHIGFLVLAGHGVPKDTISGAWEATRGFFDLDNEEKSQYISENEEEYPYGYVPLGGEVLSAGKDAEEGRAVGGSPDLKECFSIGPYNPAAGMPPVRWPKNPVQFEQAWLGYYKAMENLSANMLQAFALALHLPQNWFEDKIDRHRCSLRALNYPDQEVPPMPGQLRASPHTDYGSLTILLPDDAPGGLQVKGKSGEWLDVPHIPDAFVINLGDLMSRWTNDQWVSTLHQVVNPPVNPGRSCRRQSMAFFHNINADQMVETIPTCVDSKNPSKYPPVKAFDFLMQKHLAATGKSKKE